MFIKLMDVCWSKYAHGRSSYSFEFLSSLLILPTFFLLPVSNWTTTGRLQTVQAIDWHSRGWVYWGSLSITSKIDVMSSIENCKQSFTISWRGRREKSLPFITLWCKNIFIQKMAKSRQFSLPFSPLFLCVQQCNNFLAEHRTTLHSLLLRNSR